MDDGRSRARNVGEVLDHDVLSVPELVDEDVAVHLRLVFVRLPVGPCDAVVAGVAEEVRAGSDVIDCP